MNLKDKALEISKKLQSLADDSLSNKNIQANIELSDDQAIIFQMIKTFIKSIDSEISDNDIINMIFINGLFYEMDKMKKTKQDIYDMGNIEILADEKNIGLSDEERQVASLSVSAPKTIEEYWQLGYNTIQCPYCQSRAVFHKEHKDFQCIDGCRKAGFLNKNANSQFK